MANSIIGRYAAAFEAANISKGIAPRRDIREERNSAEQEKRIRIEKRIAYEKRRNEKFFKEHGITHDEYRKQAKNAEWVEFLGEEPALGDDDMDWDVELEKAKAMMTRFGEEDSLPEKSSKFFSYWMRHILLDMRGSSSQKLHSRDWSYVDYMDDIRIHDGQWQFSVIMQMRLELVRKHVDEGYIEFFEMFDQEMLPGERVRLWVPFGVIPDGRMYYLTGIRNGVNTAFRFIKREEHAQRVVEFFMLHRLSTVKNGTTFTSLHRKFLTVTKRAAVEQGESDKQAKLNKLWK